MKESRFLMILLFATIVVFGYQDLGNGTCICSSCTDCSSLLEAIYNGTAKCSIVKLNQSISFSGTTCISFASPLKITLDCQNYWINGTNSSSDIAMDLNLNYGGIENCRINGGYVRFYGSNVEISNVEVIYNNKTYYAVYFWGLVNATIDNMKVYSYNTTYAIFSEYLFDNVTIRNSLFYLDSITAEGTFFASVGGISKSLNITSSTIILRINNFPALRIKNVDPENVIGSIIIDSNTIVSDGSCISLEGNIEDVGLTGNSMNCKATGVILSSGSFSEISMKQNKVKIEVEGSPLFGFENANVSEMNVYDNLFNSTSAFYVFNSSFSSINLNTSKTEGPNIVGGPYIGGNYWTNPSGNGFSDTCTDSNGDGFCDNPYNITVTIGEETYTFTDYLPLTPFTPTEQPIFPNVIRSKFNLTPPFVLIFYYSYSGAFKIGFDIGGKNYYLNLSKDKTEFYIDNSLIQTLSSGSLSGTLIIDCDPTSLIIELPNGKIQYNSGCLGGALEFYCSSCKIGPLGIIYG